MTMNHPKPKEWCSSRLSKNYIADYKPFNFVDGEGVRCSLYVSGCLFNCDECFNKAAQNFTYGHPYSKELEDQILEDLTHESVQGLTLLGGEPFLNTDVALSLCKALRHKFGHTKDIWAWTGYTFEELMEETADKKELLSYIDVLVDGPFKIEERNLDLQFRGSNNQRVLDIPQTLEIKSPVKWQTSI